MPFSTASRRRISIHALTRRATICQTRLIFATQFQSTPSRGGRPGNQIRQEIRLYFNPRPHEEGDAVTVIDMFNACISIHALTRRATGQWYLYRKYQNNFNPRPHEEGDGGKMGGIESRVHFNPRPHEEGDGILRLMPPSKRRISIHALTRRATSSCNL